MTIKEQVLSRMSADPKLTIYRIAVDSGVGLTSAYNWLRRDRGLSEKNLEKVSVWLKGQENG